ncbi:MAG: ABC transporter permease subunit [Gammaproteobacteria bacterium]|nr:ABC transporter permease subunit [Gammaproteobacteria bacterium]
MKILKPIPGISQQQNASTARNDLPVLKPFRYSNPSGEFDRILFSQWLGHLPFWKISAIFALILIWPLASFAQTGFNMVNAFEALWRWLPFLMSKGFVLNVVISFFTMLIGTVAGILLGLGQISPVRFLSRTCWFITQLFRNSPWLVLLFIVMLTFPFEVEIAGVVFSIPDWMKAVFGLSLPIMANISEIVRGGIQSVPTGQWEAAESLAYTRSQTLWLVILPQCFKRMIPPWMNWYAILTMATPLVSLLRVEELVTLSRQAMESENNHPELLVPFFGFALFIFFVYCYPIAKLTLSLEKRFTVKQ